jgi:hypothetical protein
MPPETQPNSDHLNLPEKMVEAVAHHLLMHYLPPALAGASKVAAREVLEIARVSEILQYEDRGDFLVYREEWDHLRDERDSLSKALDWALVALREQRHIPACAQALEFIGREMGQVETDEREVDAS